MKTFSQMETILITTKNSEELKMIQEFLKRNNLKSRLLTDDDKEDIVLGNMMEETDYDDTISADAFLKKLRN